MYSLTITEHINGFSIVLYDWKAGKKLIDEVQEERVKALQTIRSWINGELSKEFDRRISNASIL